MTIDKSRYVIVGASAAGMAAAHAIRERDADSIVTVLSAESDLPYFRPMIPYLVSGRKKADDMMIDGCGPYTQPNIAVKTGFKVDKIDPVQKTVHANGHAIAYDKILFATGSRPFIPPEIIGTDAEGVFALRTLADARQMALRAQTSDHAVMLGGGLLNLKAAFALLETGLKVTLVVFSPQVLSQLMEPDDARLIRQALDRAGLSVMTGAAAREIAADDSGVKAVVLEDGSEISCQMVCVGKGVRPNVEFLDGSEIAVDRGIVVDRFTTCNLPGVFAAGDAAVTFDPVSGDRIMTALWTNAVEMGRCAGLNMAGVRTAYSGSFGILNATQVADAPFVSMGTVHTTGRDLEVHIHQTSDTYRKVVFNREGDRLVGAVFINNITNAGLYRYIIRDRMPVDQIKRQIIDHTLHYGHLVNRKR